MRILTPAEARQVESIKNKSGIITGIDLYDKDDNLVDAIDIELWLNILDLALQQNESLKEAWRKDKAPNWTNEVYKKLRTNE